MYYFTYRFIITKFNVMTIGRRESDFTEEDDELNGAVSISQDDRVIAKQIIEGLGGLENIADIDNCITRLRVEVLDASKIQEDLIKKSNPNGIIRPDQNTIHVVYGGRITKIRNIVDNYVYELRSQEQH